MFFLVELMCCIKTPNVTASVQSHFIVYPKSQGHIIEQHTQSLYEAIFNLQWVSQVRILNQKLCVRLFRWNLWMNEKYIYAC